MCECECTCVFRQLIISKYPTQSNKNYFYSFNLTIDVQAQIFKEGLTVEQVNDRNLGPEVRNYDRSVTNNLIN